MEVLNLKIGDKSDNGQVTIVDEDRLCYIVKSNSKGAIGLRTISKALLEEFVEFAKMHPDANANDAREKLTGKSEIDKFEYGYASTLVQLAHLAIEKTTTEESKPACLQQIFYGAPGTGKSNYIEKETKGEMVERTTFHPDSDYSTFVGAYKPTTIDVPMRDVTGKIIVEGGVKVTEKRIVYNFIPQAFLKAYTGAWKNQGKPFYLIIEEINRGNCAQIFGDLFQLLDRNKEGESVYPISPDTDIQKFLQTDSEYGFAALTKEQTNAIPENVRNGKVLILPHNLFIWATMNTSDQSLFPIDSAFKRRWDWQYVPISDAQKNWQIEVQGNRYDWWKFLQKINDKIGVATNSEDKKLGYFFCKANNDGIINAETFVGKVIFYIWNDVFKDFPDEAGDLFKDEEGNPLSFGKFYTAGIDGKAKVVEEKVTLFLEHLGVGIVDNDDDEEADDEAAIAHRKASIISIQIPGNPTIFTKDSSVIEAFAKALSQIGIERIIPVIGNLKYKRLNCPVLSTEKYPPIEKDVVYSYVQEGNLYIVKGCKQYTYIRILEDLNQMLNIGLSLVTK